MPPWKHDFVFAVVVHVADDIIADIPGDIACLPLELGADIVVGKAIDIALLESLDARQSTVLFLFFKDDNFVQFVSVDIGYVDPLGKVVVDCLTGPGAVRAGVSGSCISKNSRFPP